MFVLAPLSRPPIRHLWLGQVLAGTGAEVYGAALIWLAVGLIGSDAGYLTAVQAAAALAGSLFAGAITDRWTHGRTMITADLIRAALLLLLPLADAFGQMSLGLLIAVAIGSALLGACFDPALQATLPILAPDPRLRHATNGLLDGTRRLARILGPSLVAVLNGFVPTIQLFSVTAAALVCSAIAVRVTTSRIQEDPPSAGRGLAGTIESLTAGFRALRGHPFVIYGIFTAAIGNATWAAGFILGLVLLLKQTSTQPLTDYGLIVAAYGVGNVISNVVVASMPMRRPARWVIAGKIVFGLGIIGLALAPDQRSLMIVGAFTALNGPMGDLGMMNLLQSRFPGASLARVFRVQLCLVWAGILIGYLAAPILYQTFPIRSVMLATGVAPVLAGLAGIVLFPRRRRRAAAT